MWSAASIRATAARRASPPDSPVETYVAARLAINNWRWAGVPFLIRAGKALPVTVTEVRVRLKRPPVALFGSFEPPRTSFVFV